MTAPAGKYVFAMAVLLNCVKCIKEYTIFVHLLVVKQQEGIQWMDTSESPSGHDSLLAVREALITTTGGSWEAPIFGTATQTAQQVRKKTQQKRVNNKITFQ